MRRSLQCFAYGHGSEWQAICVDLDIAVAGRSRQDVMKRLEGAIQSYIEDAMQEDPQTRARLLSRRAPWHVRAHHAIGYRVFRLYDRFRSRRKSERRGRFQVPCHG